MPCSRPRRCGALCQIVCMCVAVWCGVVQCRAVPAQMWHCAHMVWVCVAVRCSVFLAVQMWQFAIETPVA